MAKQKLAWQTLHLTGGLEAKFAAYKAAYSKAMDGIRPLRDALESEMAQVLSAEGKVPAGKEATFNYNFGRVNVAFQDKGSGTKTKAAPALSIGSSTPAPAVLLGPDKKAKKAAKQAAAH